MSYGLQLKPGETCVAHLAPIAHSGPDELAHVTPIAHPGQICAGELSSITQALKTCADELPSYSSSRENMCSSCITYLTGEVPSKKASSSYCDLICPTCAKYSVVTNSTILHMKTSTYLYDMNMYMCVCRLCSEYCALTICRTVLKPSNNHQ